ncbi:hypothetical protein BKA01_001556 [Pseudonocardia eucalypti]|uniref:hypothetical protein n=1 Tax=Pseudonocardia eucalypti TaxID=648755 RepID=UPI00160E5DC0|nr:hypothetical protein [Pseudonocardia eucalypti]
MEQQRSQGGLSLVALDLARLYLTGGAAAIKLLRHTAVQALRAGGVGLRAARHRVQAGRRAAGQWLANYTERV